MSHAMIMRLSLAMYYHCTKTDSIATPVLPNDSHVAVFGTLSTAAHLKSQLGDNEKKLSKAPVLISCIYLIT